MAAPLRRCVFSSANKSIQNAQSGILNTCKQRFRKSIETAATVTTEEKHGEPDCLYKNVHIEVKSHDPMVLKSYQKFVTMTARELDVNIVKITTPPKVIERLTVLKSAHVHKKHRVQYETRTHYKNFELRHLTGSTTETLLEYLQRNLPEGVAMKVTKYGIEVLPEHIQQPPAHIVEESSK